jgi:valyl-tRNA synthetase
MPFLTEEIWEKLTHLPGTLIVSRYPTGDPTLDDPRAEAAVERLRALVTRVRNFRGERRVSPTEPVHLWLEPDPESSDAAIDLRELAPLLRHLGRVSELTFGPPPASAQRDVVSGVAIGLALTAGAALADRGRVEKTLAQLDKELEELSGKLRNPAFLDRAPADVVEKTRRRQAELEERRAALGSTVSE